MLTLLGTALSSILAGGATGILGVVLQRLFDWMHVREQAKQRAADQAFELEKRKIDIEIMKSEWEGRVKVAQVEGETAKDVAESQAFGASLMREPARYAEGERPAGWVGSLGWFMLVCTDVLRGVVRPLLTVYLCALTTYVWWQVKQLLSVEELDAEKVLDVWKMVVNTILYLTTTCILWWFGTRNRQSAPKIQVGG